MGVFQMWCNVCSCGFSSELTDVYIGEGSTQCKLTWINEAVVIKDRKVFYTKYDQYGRFGHQWDYNGDRSGAVLHKVCFDLIIASINLPIEQIDLAELQLSIPKPNAGGQEWEIEKNYHDQLIDISNITFEKLLCNPLQKSLDCSLWLEKPEVVKNKSRLRAELLLEIFSFLPISPSYR